MSENPLKSLFKKIKLINVLKDISKDNSKERSMCVDYVNSEVYCFKVRSLYKDDFINLTNVCLRDFGIKIYYNTQFNIIQLYELSYSINNFLYNPGSGENINDKNFCKKIENCDINKFPQNVKECREFLKSRLDIIEEGVYKINYLSF